MSTLNLHWNCHLFLHYLLVFLHLVVSLNLSKKYSDTLPREVPLNEIDDHITNRLKIVSSTLFDTQMSIDRGVSGCPC